jgi:hypothetical protein
MAVGHRQTIFHRELLFSHQLNDRQATRALTGYCWWNGAVKEPKDTLFLLQPLSPLSCLLGYSHECAGQIPITRRVNRLTYGP